MPTYSYECGKCGEVFNVFHGMSATPKVKCESCGSARTTKMLGTGAGFIFKGSGFYETDYKEKKGTPHKSESAGESKESKDTGTPKESKETPVKEVKETKKESKESTGTAKASSAKKAGAKKAS
ncbi:MAG: zinc ribbon domain-containing protein [Candidatus Hydrogenedentes bacterium]|nr:zinc ribbon domain-containing protein [Candidatus Hydrogenedentota bacterium]